MIKSELRILALTALLGCVGAGIAAVLGVPAPFLSGPALAVTFAGLAGFQLGIPVLVRNACFILIGISMGTAVTPDVIRAAKTWPLSFVAVMVAMVILLYVGYWILRYVFRYDRTTAMLAASPGHLSYVLSLSAETRSDLASVSVIQSVRVLALTLSVPLLVEYFGLVSTEPAIAAVSMSPLTLVLTLVASLAIGLLFIRWRFPAAFMLGGVAISVSTHITGFTEGSVPNWLMQPTYIMLGCLIGTRFSRVSLGDLRMAFFAGAVVTGVLGAIAVSIAMTVSHITGVPLNAAMIAFSPGGLETMAAMAVMMHVDTTYVGSHHVLRLLFLSVLMPVALGKNGRGKEETVSETIS
jgi:membrane AbrB-like protein